MQNQIFEPIIYYCFCMLYDPTAFPLRLSLDVSGPWQSNMEEHAGWGSTVTDGDLYWRVLLIRHLERWRHRGKTIWLLGNRVFQLRWLSLCYDRKGSNYESFTKHLSSCPQPCPAQLPGQRYVVFFLFGLSFDDIKLSARLVRPSDNQVGVWVRITAENHESRLHSPQVTMIYSQKYLRGYYEHAVPFKGTFFLTSPHHVMSPAVSQHSYSIW